MPISPSEWAALGAALIVPSLLSLCCYALVRWLDMAYPEVLEWAKIVVLLGVCLLCVFTVALALFPLAIWFAVFGLLSFPGALLHRQSTGGILTLSHSFYSVLFSVWSTHLLGLILGYFWADSPWWQHPAYCVGITLLGWLFYPVLAPVAVWAWTTGRVRPGIDEPLQD